MSDEWTFYAMLVCLALWFGLGVAAILVRAKERQALEDRIAALEKAKDRE